VLLGAVLPNSFLEEQVGDHDHAGDPPGPGVDRVVGAAPSMYANRTIGCTIRKTATTNANTPINGTKPMGTNMITPMLKKVLLERCFKLLWTCTGSDSLEDLHKGYVWNDWKRNSVYLLDQLFCNSGIDSVAKPVSCLGRQCCLKLFGSGRMERVRKIGVSGLIRTLDVNLSNTEGTRFDVMKRRRLCSSQ
jgi:hypothetical protein